MNEQLRRLALILLLAVATPAAAGQLSRVVVHGKSLEGNLSCDSPDREVSVYLPPGYEKGRGR